MKSGQKKYELGNWLVICVLNAQSQTYFSSSQKLSQQSIFFLGSVDKILEKPYKSPDKIYKTHKNLRRFIESGKNTPKVLNFTEKTLN